jgi:hypothetical protein
MTGEWGRGRIDGWALGVLCVVASLCCLAGCGGGSGSSESSTSAIHRTPTNREAKLDPRVSEAKRHLAPGEAVGLKRGQVATRQAKADVERARARAARQIQQAKAKGE